MSNRHYGYIGVCSNIGYIHHYSVGFSKTTKSTLFLKSVPNKSVSMIIANTGVSGVSLMYFKYKTLTLWGRTPIYCQGKPGYRLESLIYKKVLSPENGEPRDAFTFCSRRKYKGPFRDFLSSQICPDCGIFRKQGATWIRTWYINVKFNWLSL